MKKNDISVTAELLTFLLLHYPFKSCTYEVLLLSFVHPIQENVLWFFSYICCPVQEDLGVGEPVTPSQSTPSIHDSPNIVQGSGLRPDVANLLSQLTAHDGGRCMILQTFFRFLSQIFPHYFLGFYFFRFLLVFLLERGFLVLLVKTQEGFSADSLQNSWGRSLLTLVLRRPFPENDAQRCALSLLRMALQGCEASFSPTCLKRCFLFLKIILSRHFPECWFDPKLCTKRTLFI